MRAFSQKELGPQIATWVEAGLITGEQGNGILARYPATAPKRWPIAFILLGGVLCLGGIILVIASNWQEIPAVIKVAGLLALLAGSYVLGIETQRAGRSRAWWELGYLGAAVFPLLGIMLVSQIFHMTGDATHLCLVWTLIISPLPILTRSIASFNVFLTGIFFTLINAVTSKSGFWDTGAEFRVACVTISIFGVVAVLLSQLWQRLGEPALRNAGEYFGLLAGFFAIYILGCGERYAWMGVWLVLFLASLGVIARAYQLERVHQVNLGFCMVGLVVLSTFFRLVGTMLNTGVIFIFGGLIIIGCVCALEWVRRRLVKEMKA